MKSYSPITKTPRPAVLKIDIRLHTKDVYPSGTAGMVRRQSDSLSWFQAVSTGQEFLVLNSEIEVRR